MDASDDNSTVLQTLRVALPKPPDALARNAILVQIYPTCLTMGLRYPLGDRPLDIGRGETCDLRLDHASVSRRHARINPTPAGYRAEDLGSTNGTYLNNVLVCDTLLQDGDYLRIGCCMFRFLMGSNVEAEYHEEIYRLTIIDALTETHNKRYLLEFLDRELVRAFRHQRRLTLVLFDLDHFKRINDEQGHLCGDHTLREVAVRARSVTRKDELLARYGGEEFAVVLPELGIDEAVAVAERIRAVVEATPYEYQGQVYPVTVSLGVATSEPSDQETLEHLIGRADAALYQAKSAGRNCVRVSARAEAPAALPSMGPQKA